jgi:hypothetical protein
MADGIGSIGSSGLTSFDLGGVAPNGGGPEPTGFGDLGAAGLSPIGSSGIDAFGDPGDGAALAHYDDLVQQNQAQLDGSAAQNQAFAQSLQTTPTIPTYTPPIPGPVPFADPASPLDTFAAFTPPNPTFALAPPAVGPNAPPLPPDALASPVITPDVPALGFAPTDPVPATSAFGLAGPVAPEGTDGLALPAGAFADGTPSLVGAPPPQPAPGAAPDGDALVFRGSILPLGRTANGDIVPAWPGFLVGLANAVTYPGRVLSGEATVIDPATGQPTDEAIANSLAIAGLVGGGGLVGGAEAGAGETVLGAGAVRTVPTAASEARLAALTRGEMTGEEVLAARRGELGIPAAGAPGDNATLSLLRIGDRSFEGINRGLQAPPTAMSLERVNAQTLTHAEADVVQQAVNAGLAGTARTAEMVIDRAPCLACGQYGGLRSLARNLGVDELRVSWPGGQQTFTPTK